MAAASAPPRRWLAVGVLSLVAVTVVAVAVVNRGTSPATGPTTTTTKPADSSSSTTTLPEVVPYPQLPPLPAGILVSRDGGGDVATYDLHRQRIDRLGLSDVCGAVASPDGTHLAALVEGRLTLIGREVVQDLGPAEEFAWSPDSDRLLALTRDGSLVVVEMEGGRLTLPGRSVSPLAEGWLAWVQEERSPSTRHWWRRQRWGCRVTSPKVAW